MGAGPQDAPLVSFYCSASSFFFLLRRRFRGHSGVVAVANIIVDPLFLFLAAAALATFLLGVVRLLGLKQCRVISTLARLLFPLGIWSVVRMMQTKIVQSGAA